MKKIMWALIVGVFLSFPAGMCSTDPENIPNRNKPYVVLNGRKLTKGENFSFLTDCGFYRFTIKEVKPDFGMVILEYPSTISGGSPDAIPPFKKKDTAYEDGLPLGTTCYLMNDCLEKNNQVCFMLQKKKTTLHLSYVIKRPPHKATTGPVQKTEAFFKSGLTKEKKDSEKKVTEEKKTAPSNWFVY